jgi:uncharacterized membrane protein YfcA
MINGIAALTFIVTGAVVWSSAVAMTAGAALGGYFVAHYAQKLPQPLIRAMVITLGLSMTVYFLWKEYR